MSAVQCMPVQYIIMQCSELNSWFSAVQYITVECSTVQYNVVQYSTIECSAVQSSVYTRTPLSTWPLSLSLV